MVLNHLVATTLSAPRFAADYECCTWNPLPPGWVSTASGVSGSFGGSVGHAVVGLDCEMVQAAEPYGTSLARVTVVALGAVKPGAKRADCVVLLDELVSEKANPLEHSVPLHNASCCTTHAQLRPPPPLQHTPAHSDQTCSPVSARLLSLSRAGQPGRTRSRRLSHIHHGTHRGRLWSGARGAGVCRGCSGAFVFAHKSKQ